MHSSTIHNSQDMETTYMSIKWWMDKDVVHIHNRILLSHKKEWNNAIFSNMGGLRDCDTKWKANTIWYHLYVESKIWHKWTYIQNRNRLREQSLSCQGWRGEGWIESLGLADTTFIYGMDKQQDPTI